MPNNIQIDILTVMDSSTIKTITENIIKVLRQGRLKWKEGQISPSEQGQIKSYDFVFKMF